MPYGPWLSLILDVILAVRHVISIVCNHFVFCEVQILYGPYQPLLEPLFLRLSFYNSSNPVQSPATVVYFPSRYGQYPSDTAPESFFSFSQMIIYHRKHAISAEQCPNQRRGLVQRAPLSLLHDISSASNMSLARPGNSLKLLYYRLCEVHSSTGAATSHQDAT